MGRQALRLRAGVVRDTHAVQSEPYVLRRCGAKLQLPLLYDKRSVIVRATIKFVIIGTTAIQFLVIGTTIEQFVIIA
jgi:hypothetical protein